MELLLPEQVMDFLVILIFLVFRSLCPLIFELPLDFRFLHRFQRYSAIPNLCDRYPYHLFLNIIIQHLPPDHFIDYIFHKITNRHY